MSETSNLLVNKNGCMTVITLNRPSRRNALTPDMLQGIILHMTETANDPNTSMLAITGAGDYFTSGNDLANFADTPLDSLALSLNIKTNGPPTLDDVRKGALELFNRFVQSFIDFPKLLVAVLNGPSVGLGVTLLPLFDLVYVTETVTLWTPFTMLGQVPEGCSTYTFPRLLGYSRAMEVLLMGRKVSAEEAVAWGLASLVVSRSELPTLWIKLKHLADSSPPAALAAGRLLMRQQLKPTLHRVNDAECNELLNRWSSEEFFECILRFFNEKSKL